MNALRFLRGECIQLPLATQPTSEPPDETPDARRRRLQADKGRVLAEIAAILDRSGAVVNPSKLLRDLDHRERKASTAILPGIAIPHVRSLQVRTFLLGLATAAEPGLPFGSADGEPTRLFFLLASPPYDDGLYLQVYRVLMQVITDEALVDLLIAAQRPQEVFNLLRGTLDR